MSYGSNVGFKFKVFEVKQFQVMIILECGYENGGCCGIGGGEGYGYNNVQLWFGQGGGWFYLFGWDYVWDGGRSWVVEEDCEGVIGRRGDRSG